MLIPVYSSESSDLINPYCPQSSNLHGAPHGVLWCLPSLVIPVCIFLNTRFGPGYTTWCQSTLLMLSDPSEPVALLDPARDKCFPNLLSLTCTIYNLHAYPRLKIKYTCPVSIQASLTWTIYSLQDQLENLSVCS